LKKKLNKTVSLIFFLALISLSSTTALIPLVAAEYPNGYFYFKPTDYIYTTDDLSVGDTFQAEIYCQNLLDLYAWQVMVSFNATLLNVQSMGFLPDEPLHQGAHMKVGPDIDNAAGTVLFAVTSLETFGVDTILETGLCYIVFKIMASPPTMGYVESDLTLVTTGAPKCKWESYSPAVTYYPDTTDGYYKYSSPMLAKLAVDPREICDPTLLPPATFQINVTIDDVKSMYGYMFNLSYNPGLLMCISFKIHDVLDETNYIPEFSVDNWKGFVWVRVTYYSPAQPLTTFDPLALVTIVFRVKAMGATNLTLHDTSLTNPTGEPIPHEVLDGYFCSVIRDVAVIEVTTSSTEVYVGWPVNVSVTVRNEGDLTETFNVTTYYDNNIIYTITVNNLTSGEQTTLMFGWNTTEAIPCNNYTMKAEASTVPYEADIADNICVNGHVKIKLTGDVNGDGVVDISDISAIARAYGSYPGHPRWDPDLDLNRDKIIDISDVSLTARNFGNTC